MHHIFQNIYGGRYPFAMHSIRLCTYIYALLKKYLHPSVKSCNIMQICHLLKKKNYVFLILKRTTSIHKTLVVSIVCKNTTFTVFVRFLKKTKTVNFTRSCAFGQIA